MGHIAGKENDLGLDALNILSGLAFTPDPMERQVQMSGSGSLMASL